MCHVLIEPFYSRMLSALDSMCTESIVRRRRILETANKRYKKHLNVIKLIEKKNKSDTMWKMLLDKEQNKKLNFSKKFIIHSDSSSCTNSDDHSLFETSDEDYTK